MSKFPIIFNWYDTSWVSTEVEKPPKFVRQHVQVQSFQFHYFHFYKKYTNHSCIAAGAIYDRFYDAPTPQYKKRKCYFYRMRCKHFENCKQRVRKIKIIITAHYLCNTLKFPFYSAHMCEHGKSEGLKKQTTKQTYCGILQENCTSIIPSRCRLTLSMC